MATTSNTERIRDQQAAGTYIPTPSGPVGATVVAAGALFGALLTASSVLGSALWARPIIERIKSENSGDLDFPGWYDHPTAEEEICRLPYDCFAGDALYFAGLWTAIGIVLLITGLVTTLTLKSRWKPHLLTGAAIVGALLAAPYIFFAEVIDVVSQITE